MGRKSVLRKLTFPKELFEKVAAQVNSEIVEALDLQGIPSKRLGLLQKFSEKVNIDKLEEIDGRIEEHRKKMRELSKEDREKVSLSDDQIMDGLYARLTCPERVRKSICDILIQSARTSALSNKRDKIDEENKKRKENGKQPLKAGLSPEDFEITAGMRREFYRAIVRPDGDIGEVKLDDEEWSLLEPIWSDEGKDRESWQFGVYTEACVLAIKNEIIDKAEEIDMKA